MLFHQSLNLSIRLGDKALELFSILPSHTFHLFILRLDAPLHFQYLLFMSILLLEYLFVHVSFVICLLTYNNKKPEVSTNLLLQILDSNVPLKPLIEHTHLQYGLVLENTVILYDGKDDALQLFQVRETSSVGYQCFTVLIHNCVLNKRLGERVNSGSYRHYFWIFDNGWRKLRLLF